jgi:hypothetical protein
MKRIRVLLFTFVYLLALTACEKEKDTPQIENKLSAKAGQDITVEVSTLVQLNGSASTDGNGKTFTYGWTLKSQPNGSQADLTNENTDKPSFTPDLAGAYVVELRIANETGESKDEVTVMAETTTTPPPVTVMINGDITEDMVLENIIDDPDQADYIVTALVNVGAKLTVAPGVKVVFEEDKGMIIQSSGKLIANGTESQMVTFTGKEEEVGYWAGILIRSNSLENVMNYTEILYAGSTAMYPMENPTALGVTDMAYLEFKNSTIAYAADNGLFVKVGGLIDLENNYFSNNDVLNVVMPVNQAHKMDAESRIEAKNEGLNRIELIGDRIDLDTEVTWNSLSNGTIYKLVNDVVLASGLKIAPGTHLGFNPDKFLKVVEEGYLNAKGTNSGPIKMMVYPEINVNWGGIVFQSSNYNNLLEWVEIYNAGNGETTYGTSKSAAVYVNSLTSGKLSMKDTYIQGSEAYGLYVEKNASLEAFDNNMFEENAGTALALPASELPDLTATSVRTSLNGQDAVEILNSVLNADEELTIHAFEDGTSYYISELFDILSGVVVKPGVNFEFGRNAMMIVRGDGYLTAEGTASTWITFSGKNKENGYWGGIQFTSSSSQNRMSYCEVSHGGSKTMPSLPSVKANIGLSAIVRTNLNIQNSIISHGGGWGIAVESELGAVINDDAETANQFDDLVSGSIYKY